MLKLFAAQMQLALVIVTLTTAISAPISSQAASESSVAHAAFRVYVPTWLPSGFHRVADPVRALYPKIARTRIMRRYGTNDKWVEVFEGSAGCCLDSVSNHLVGPTRLSQGRIAYFSDQGAQFGGFYLFWDQRGTYICLNSPYLSKSTLLHVARSLSASGAVHP